MNSNFEWQKHQTNQRVQARLQEAAAHRQAKQGAGRSPVALPLRMVVLAGVGLIVAIWLLAGCTTTASTVTVASETAAIASEAQTSPNEIEIEVEIEKAAGSVPGQTMAGRIHFQDQREQYLAAGRDSAINPADRKFFNAGVSTATGTAATMEPADRKFLNAANAAGDQ